MQAAEFPGRDVDGSLHVRLAGDVAVHEHGVDAMPCRLGSSRGVIEVDQHRASPGGDDHVDRGAPEAGRAAGHQYRPAVEIHRAIVAEQGATTGWRGCSIPKTSMVSRLLSAMPSPPRNKEYMHEEILVRFR